MSIAPRSLVGAIRQSKPVDTSEPYDAAWVKGKTILITGGASGFGEGFFRLWAENGANVIIGDINDRRGEALVAEVRKNTGNDNHHYIHCNVTDWQSQVNFFKQAAQFSPTGGIDAVVANAGIGEAKPTFEHPKDMDADVAPPKPNLLCLDVNLTGVLYTTHLAMFWLPRNQRAKPASPSSDPSAQTGDRHILLIGSMASLSPIPHQVLYGVSKHGVLGLFRTLRSTSFLHGIRVNLLCPYFVDTPIVPAMGRMLLAGGAMGKPEDVIDAGTRLMADSRICGRSLVVGPKVKVDDEMHLVAEGGKELAVWEAYSEDFEQVELFNSRLIGLLNEVEYVRGWIGWAKDMVGAFVYPIRRYLRG